MKFERQVVGGHLGALPASSIAAVRFCCNLMCRVRPALGYSAQWMARRHCAASDAGTVMAEGNPIVRLKALVAPTRPTHVVADADGFPEALI